MAEQTPGRKPTRPDWYRLRNRIHDSYLVQDKTAKQVRNELMAEGWIFRCVLKIDQETGRKQS